MDGKPVFMVDSPVTFKSGVKRRKGAIWSGVILSFLEDGRAKVRTAEGFVLAVPLDQLTKVKTSEEIAAEAAETAEKKEDSNGVASGG